MRPLVLAALLLAPAVPDLRALDVSGTYEAAGKVLSQPDGPAGGPVSLRALLALEFDHERAAVIHEATVRVKLEQAARSFRIKCLDGEGAATWQHEWKLHEGYDSDKEKVRLLLRYPTKEEPGLLFLLRLGERNELLTVEIQRVTHAWYGAAFKPAGTFYFLRALE